MGQRERKKEKGGGEVNGKILGCPETSGMIFCQSKYKWNLLVSSKSCPEEDSLYIVLSDYSRRRNYFLMSRKVCNVIGDTAITNDDHMHI